MQVIPVQKDEFACMLPALLLDPALPAREDGDKYCVEREGWDPTDRNAADGRRGTTRPSVAGGPSSAANGAIRFPSWSLHV